MGENWAFGGGPVPLDSECTGSITLVDGSDFCISAPNGDIHPGSAHGLFVRDTRFLSRWELRVNGQPAQLLTVERSDPLSAVFLCRTPPRPGHADSTMLVVRRRFLGGGLREEIELHNLGSEAAGCSLTLLVDADFADLFEVKENRVGVRPEPVIATVDLDGVQLHYRWMGQHRGVRVAADRQPTAAQRLLGWQAIVAERSVWRVSLQVVAAVSEHELQARPDTTTAAELLPSAQRVREWRLRGTTVRTSNTGLRQTILRSEDDLGALRVNLPEHPDRVVMAAGAPWFMTLFGRDSVLTSWMALSLDPRIALGTLQTLADLQGSTLNPLSEEQPGRILHEIRFGMGMDTVLGGGHAYYGTIDATPLFVMLLGELRAWGVAPELIQPLLPHADRALAWVEEHGDLDGDGFVEYRRMTDQGLVNQGWKDSWDGVTFARGRVADPPIALCEVQGYVYAALRARALFALDAGDTVTAERLLGRAAALKTAFNQAFWLPDRQYFALALDADKQPVDGLASNMGHCLWTGIVDQDKARAVADHLLGEDLFSGWGVRTLASSMGAYNPMSYHNGSVWPHDNALIAAGLMRYGFVSHAQRVALAILDAAESFGGRLPELFCGFARETFSQPVPYPTSCAPQAWAAATPIYLLRTLLRCDPGVPEHALWLDPVVPDALLPLGIDRLPVNGSLVSVNVRAEGWEVHGVPEHITVRAEPRYLGGEPVGVPGEAPADGQQPPPIPTVPAPVAPVPLPPGTLTPIPTPPTGVRPPRLELGPPVEAAAGGPEPAQSEPARSESARSEPARSESAQSESARSEPARSEPASPRTARKPGSVPASEPAPRPAPAPAPAPAPRTVRERSAERNGRRADRSEPRDGGSAAGR